MTFKRKTVLSDDVLSHQQILEQAIAKAIAGGWKGVPSTSFMEGYGLGVYLSGKELLTWRFEMWHGTLTDGEYEDYQEVRIEAIIFNHDFAKALWGEARDAMGIGFKRNIGTPEEYEWSMHMKAPTWELKLAQMVIAPDPITYLGANL